jgi:hypothetical protein
MNNNDAEDIIIDDDIITKKEFDFIDNKITGIASKFPFYRAKSTGDIIMLSHAMIDRDEPVIKTKPEFFYFFQEILVRFCDKHKIKSERIYRAIINLGHENTEYKQTHPHIDLFRPGYKVAIIYLNDVANEPEYNSTIIYKERATNPTKDIIDLSLLDTLNIEAEVFPKKGRIVCFDGMRYHANYFSKGNEFRFVMIFNFD